VVSRPIREL